MSRPTVSRPAVSRLTLPRPTSRWRPTGFALALAQVLAVAGAQAALPAAPSEAALQAVSVKRVVKASVAVPGTPKELNASITVRYGVARPRAVLILMPGFLGGAGSLDRLSRQIVALDSSVAVWAIDRRSNLLEPQQELARANRAGLETIVQKGLPVRPAESVTYLKDWGLDVTLKDWRTAVLEAHLLTPNVFLGGHSMGAALTGLYAAYDFGGRAGQTDVKGLVMLDGFPGLLSGKALTLEQYQKGGLNVLGPLAGLNALERNPYVNALYFGPLLASRGAAQARLAAQFPHEPAPVDGLTPFPATNLAAAALQVEQRYALLPFMTLNTGRPVNALEAPSLAARALGGQESHWLTGPEDRTKPVGWDIDPAAPTDALDFVGRYWNPVSDYTEWYFPNRMLLDLAAARTTTRGTPFEQDLRVWHTANVRLPMLGIAAGEGVTKAADYEGYAAQTRGKLTTHTLPGVSHLDITAARSDQVARWTLEWLRSVLGH